MMGKMKEMAIDISYSLGLDGDITPDVTCIAERVLAVHRENDSKRKVTELMGIGRLMRELRQEIAFDQGRLCKRICAWCEETMGYIEGQGITHGICQSCAAKLMSDEKWHQEIMDEAMKGDHDGK